MAQKASEVANLLKPFIVQWINDASRGGSGTPANAGGVYAPTPHALNSYHHNGQLPHNSVWLSGLTDDTHPIYASADTYGTRSAYQAERLNRTISASSGLLGGGILTSDRDVSVDLNFDFNWTGFHSITRTSEQLRLAYSASNFTSFVVGSGGNLTVSPTGDFVFDPLGKDVYPNTGYDLNLGLINKKWLTLHAAELWAETLVTQNTLATIGGRILVGPTTSLTTSLGSASTDTTIYVKHNQMTNNDIVYMEAAGKVEFMRVSGSATGAGSPYAYTVVRDLDGTGRDQWYEGDALFNTGQAGNGFIDLYSLRGVGSSTQYGPTIVGNIRSSSTYNDWAEHWAVGNLNGLYGYSGSAFGFAAGKYSASTSWIAIDSASGIRMMYGTGTQFARWDISGCILIGQTGVGQDNLLLSSGCIVLRNNTTPVITLHSASDANGLIASFDGAIGISTNGGIYQGTGTFTSPSTGLKVWNDGGVGRIVGYNGSASQAGFSTDGKLYAGGGDVVLSASGVFLYGQTSEVYTESKSLNLVVGSTLVGGIWGWKASTGGVHIEANSSGSSAPSELLLIGRGYGSVRLQSESASLLNCEILLSDSVYVHGNSNFDADVNATGQLSASGRALFGNHSGSSLFNTSGVLVNQGSASNEIFTLKAAEVAHGMTSLTDTDTYGAMTKISASKGGLAFHGFSASTLGISMRGVVTTENTAKSTAAEGGIILTTSVKSGTSNADVSASANVLVIRNRATAHFILDGAGNSYQDLGTAWTNFDRYDDVHILNQLSANLGRSSNDPIGKEFGEFLEDNRDVLERIGLVTFNLDGHHFVNMSKLTMLLTGAIRQVAQRNDALESQLAFLTQKLAMLDRG